MNNSSIGDALFTKTQQRVLAILYGNTERSYYLNELVRLAGMGKGAVSRELAKLSDAGILIVSKQGNQRHYKANKDNPIYSELKQIVQKSFGVTDIIKSALKPILNQCEQVYIYGSIAKGNEHSTSDVDLMLIGHELSYGAIMDLLDDAEIQLARKINPTILSSAEFQERINNQQSFATRVMEQPKLWIKEEHR